MFRSLLGIIGLGGPEYDARVLTRDARAMIDMLRKQHRAEALSKIAEHAAQQIGVVHRRGLGDPQYYGRGVTELTDLNRAARARRDDIAWSGITLTIIYIKAEMLGEIALPARHAIDGFLEQWGHAADDTANGNTPPPEDEPGDA